jgi:hypothetical protein
MSAITILDVVLGLAFVYVLFSMMCSTVIEWLSAVLARRARLLKRGIEQALGRALAREFSQHALITGLGPANGYPNYIPASTFSRVLINLTTDAVPAGGLTRIVAKDSLPDNEKQLIQSLVFGADTVSGALTAGRGPSSLKRSPRTKVASSRSDAFRGRAAATTSRSWPSTARAGRSCGKASRIPPEGGSSTSR